ncbi:amidohydrolase family protein, partial [Campylobacter jejuni]
NLHSITHCAFSNRLLSQKTFDLKKALKSGLNIHLGTDGLSSNISLSILDEMRASLLVHTDFDLLKLAPKLLQMATLYPAKALNLNLGEIKQGKMADFSVFELGECNKE